MEKKDFINALSHDWKGEDLESLYNSSLIDKSISVDEWKQTFVGAFCIKKKSHTHILKYLAESLGKDVPEWSDLTKSNMVQFRDYLLSHVSPNSAKQYLSVMKGVFSVYNEDNVLPAKDYRYVTQVKATPSEHIALTKEELELIDRYQPHSKVEEDVKRAFMIEALCGARHSDVMLLTESNIDTTGKWLTYVSQKTKTKTTVPVHRNLLKYLQQKPHKEHSRGVFNETIQRIALKCGITQETELYTKGQHMKAPRYEFIGSHTARRSFATQLAVVGVPVAIISKFMGHASVDQTSRYIYVEQTQIGTAAEAFFN